jgi:hypothetical protein
MGFNFPSAPQHSVFPYTAHVAADIYIWVIALALFAFAIREWVKTGSPLGVVLLIGGALAYFNEPVDDILGLVWHARIHQDTVLNTIGPLPMWGLPTYIIFFGGIPWLLLREFRRVRFTITKFWIGVLLTFLADLLIEIPLLQTNLYVYYGHGGTPLTIARFPLYWLLINTTGPILCAAILFAVPDYFRGWRAPFLILLPAAADAACSIVVGLPVYSTLHAPHVSQPTRWLGALASCAIGFVILDAESRWIMARTSALRTRSAAAVSPDDHGQGASLRQPALAEGHGASLP